MADHIGLLHRAERKVVRGCEGEADTTLFLVDGMVAAVVCWRRLRVQWLEEARRDAGGLESLPDFISLPRDEEGRPIIPTSRVTALVEAKEAWATALGTLAKVTRSITRGQLIMPRIVVKSQQTALRNHPWWEKDEDAKRGWAQSSRRGWSQASWSMLRGPIACPSCCSRVAPSPRAPLRSICSQRTRASQRGSIWTGRRRTLPPRSSAAR